MKFFVIKTFLCPNSIHFCWRLLESCWFNSLRQSIAIESLFFLWTIDIFFVTQTAICSKILSLIFFVCIPQQFSYQIFFLSFCELVEIEKVTFSYFICQKKKKWASSRFFLSDPAVWNDQPEFLSIVPTVCDTVRP